ncbi:Phosphoribosyl 1,2-cyclic phosphodiesterase [Mucilaginibacter mallensis]|uniref:Phosphoribosyl 1,2-cyclic phosphodiesterase n=1 Tax=Mucilaginibacter mallensis TaxID=652787 RepID=A0A1H1TLU3_MUCMA|nr:MBL fold metallo-hydrolase [Mucilaginibacter mallensis]SDS61031.1 Phosphoribosyl 1,2-cyclic phosphodiesterase [Mucilaginibacter mallensis]
MSLFITSLNSGSNGNCYYIGNEHEAILVDAGISCRETEKRMKRLGLSINKVKAIFISHEHTDHISGIPVLAKKFNIPVYITPGTLKHLNVNFEDYSFINFIAHEAVMIGELAVTAFPKFHDASEPHSFIVTCRDITVGIFTDIGVVCDNLIANFQKCHAAFLEANYDDEMLDNGGYPYHLKRRIRGGNGHLSNKQALELFINHKPAYMSHLLLAHLSKNNNDPSLVYELFNSHANGTEVVVASRYEETPVYYIGGTEVIGGRAKQLAFDL